MDLTSAVACAAFLMGQPVPDVNLLIVEKTIPLAECADAGRPEGCAGLEHGDPAMSPPAMLVRLDPRWSDVWSVQVHAGCHVVQLGHGFAHRGPGAERQCEWVEAHAEQCR